MAIEPRLLKGFRDHLPQPMAQRQWMLQTIEGVLQTYAFLPIETPTLEYADILLGKLGDEGEKLLYRFRDHGDRDVAMRYDLTVPLARVVAQYPTLPKPFKRYQVGPVWRADNTQRGRYREFYQFDMDIVGSDTILADAEILALMQAVLKALGLRQFTIRVNDRRYLATLARAAGLLPEQHSSFYTGLDKWDKIGQAGVVEYWQEHGLSLTQANDLLQRLLNRDQHPSEETVALAKELGLEAEHVIIDPVIVRGLDYYTGIVFETTLPQAPEYGSVFSGGRYDNLVSTFSQQSVPAVGTSVGVDRLFAALDQFNLLPDKSAAALAFVCVFDQAQQSASLRLAASLRQAGIPTDMALQTGNLGKQLKSAASRHIPWAIIIGPDEVSQNKLTLRNLVDGREQLVTVDQAIKQLQHSQ